MKKNHKYNKDFTDKANESSEDKIENMEDWRNEHGQPDFEYLQSLAEDGGPAALEKLRAIAGDLDVGCDSGASTEQLIARIRRATGNDSNDTT